MKSKYHKEITQKALGAIFSEYALRVIIRANIRQDRIRYQFGHDYIHFDGSAFVSGFNYIQEQETILINSVGNNQTKIAWKALGCLLHSWQDFYSHSNFVHLWISKYGFKEPQCIIFDDRSIIEAPNLTSGKNYGIIEFVALLPIIKNVIKPFMPQDSHAKMNLDDPGASPYFKYAYIASLYRTKNVCDNLLEKMKNNHLSEDQIEAFFGNKSAK